LKASTHSDEMKIFLKGKSSIFRNILLNEELYSSKMVKEIPIDIENTFIGREMSCLIECISGLETI
jgi:hypothetical protein